jgi:2OG-Fe(II) oxygenase superfamily
LETLDYGIGGELLWHTDHESIYTMVIMLTEQGSEYQGGSFVTTTAAFKNSNLGAPKITPADTITIHPKKYGGVLFDSNAEHGVERISGGNRRVIAIEFWDYEDSSMYDLRPKAGEGGAPKVQKEMMVVEDPTHLKYGFEKAGSRDYLLMGAGVSFGLATGILLTILLTDFFDRPRSGGTRRRRLSDPESLGPVIRIDHCSSTDSGENTSTGRVGDLFDRGEERSRISSGLVEGDDTAIRRADGRWPRIPVDPRGDYDDS